MTKVTPKKLKSFKHSTLVLYYNRYDVIKKANNIT